jgi:hypothetical protein
VLPIACANAKTSAESEAWEQWSTRGRQVESPKKNIIWNYGHTQVLVVRWLWSQISIRSWLVMAWWAFPQFPLRVMAKYFEKGICLVVSESSHTAQLETPDFKGVSWNDSNHSKKKKKRVQCPYQCTRASAWGLAPLRCLGTFVPASMVPHGWYTLLCYN